MNFLHAFYMQAKQGSIESVSIYYTGLFGASDKLSLYSLAPKKLICQLQT